MTSPVQYLPFRACLQPRHASQLNQARHRAQPSATLHAGTAPAAPARTCPTTFACSTCSYPSSPSPRARTRRRTPQIQLCSSAFHSTLAQQLPEKPLPHHRVILPRQIRRISTRSIPQRHLHSTADRRHLTLRTIFQWYGVQSDTMSPFPPPVAPASLSGGQQQSPAAALIRPQSPPSPAATQLRHRVLREHPACSRCCTHGAARLASHVGLAGCRPPPPASLHAWA